MTPGDPYEYQGGSRYRLETFFSEEENHTQAPRWASNHDHFT